MKRFMTNCILVLFFVALGCSKALAGSSSNSNDLVSVSASWNDETGAGSVWVGLVKTTSYDATGVVTYELDSWSLVAIGTNSSSSGSSFSLPYGGSISVSGTVSITADNGTTNGTSSKKSFQLGLSIKVTPPEPKVTQSTVTYSTTSETEGSVNVILVVGLENATVSTASNNISVSQNGSGTISVSYTGKNGKSYTESKSYNVNWIKPSITSGPTVTYSPSGSTDGSVTATATIGLKNASSGSASNSVTVSENKGGTITISYTGTNGRSYSKDVSYNVNWIKPTITSGPTVTYSPSGSTKGSVTVRSEISLKNATSSSASNSITVEGNGSGTITISYTGTDGKSYTASKGYNVTWIQPTVTNTNVSYTPRTGTKGDVDVTATITVKNAKQSSYSKKITVGSNTGGNITIPYTGTDNNNYSETLSYNVTWIMPTVLSTDISYSTTQNTNGNVTVTGTITTKNATKTTWTNSETKTKNCSGTIYVNYTGTDGNSYSQGISYSVGNIDKIDPVVSYTVHRFSIIGKNEVTSDTEYEAIRIDVTSTDSSSTDYCSSGTNKIYINGTAYSGSSKSITYYATVNSSIEIYSVDNVGNIGDKKYISDFVGELIEPISMTIESGDPYLRRNNVVVPLHITDGTRYLRKIYVDGVQKTTPAWSTDEPYLLTVSTDKEDVSGTIKIVDKKGVERNYPYEIHDILKKGQQFRINIAGGNVKINDDSSKDIVYFGSKVGEEESTVVCVPSKKITLYGTSSLYNLTINNTHGRTLNLENLTISASGRSPISVEGNSNIHFLLLGGNSLTSSGTYAGINVSTNASLLIKGSGEILVQSLGSGASIGGNSSTNAGDIELLQGKFILKNSGTGSALGSGEGKSIKNITLRGADVYAVSQEGAAIGSGKNGQAGKIEITGGTVVAKSTKGGAAIGSGRGDSSKVTNVFIKGGSIYASASGNGAGIGSGLESYVERIRINNGSINCEASGDGVGIGAGRYASVKYVIINDGNITCKNIGRGGALGTGYGGAINDSITINGGYVEAYTNGEGAGIGNSNVKVKGGVVKAYSKSGYDISGNNIIIDKWANVELYNNKMSSAVKRSDGKNVSQIKIAIPQAKDTQSFLTIVEGDNSYRVRTDKNGLVYWWENGDDNIDFWYKGLKY